MTLRKLILSNIKGLRRKYAAFLFSSVLAITVFYLLASFVLHTDVVNGHVSQAESVRAGLVVAQCIIVAFSFFFVLYSSSAFVRSRKKEFGLLSLLGGTKRQLSRFVVTEHIIIGAASIGVGLSLGIPLSKLMLRAMSSMLQVASPIRFMVVTPAVALTVGLFMVLFIFIGSITALQISPRKVILLLRDHQRPKTLPSYSPLIASFSLLLIGGGYLVAWFVDGNTLVLAMLPVTLVVSFGTFLFFSQASVGILRKLQNRPSFIYRNLNLLTFGDLVFRMKENARVLASVAVLSACVITATGTIYTAQATLLADEEHSCPHAVTFSVSGEANPASLRAAVVQVLEEDKAQMVEEVFLTGILAGTENRRDTHLMVSEQAYNDWAQGAELPKISLEGKEAALLVSYEGGSDPDYRVPVEITYHDEQLTLEATTVQFPATNWVGLFQHIVVDDALFESLAKTADASERATFMSFELQDWQKSLRTGSRIRAAIPDEHLIGYSSRLESYEARKQMTSLTIMIALFVTVLFFIASGSMLYFRLFGEIDEDRAKCRTMRKLGVSRGEVVSIVTKQVLVFFFAPITVGAVHCGFAMKALSNVLSGMHWPFLGVFRYAIWAIAGFTAIQIVYFLVARWAYVREILEVPGT